MASTAGTFTRSCRNAYVPLSPECLRRRSEEYHVSRKTWNPVSSYRMPTLLLVLSPGPGEEEEEEGNDDDEAYSALARAAR